MMVPCRSSSDLIVVTLWLRVATVVCCSVAAHSSAAVVVGGAG